MKYPRANWYRLAPLFLAEPNTPQWLTGLMQKSGVQNGSVQPVLKRWEELNWITRFRDESPFRPYPGRARILYLLTPDGFQQLKDNFSKMPEELKNQIEHISNTENDSSD